MYSADPGHIALQCKEMSRSRLTIHLLSLDLSVAPVEQKADDAAQGGEDAADHCQNHGDCHCGDAPSHNKRQICEVHLFGTNHLRRPEPPLVPIFGYSSECTRGLKVGLHLLKVTSGKESSKLLYQSATNDQIRAAKWETEYSR